MTKHSLRFMIAAGIAAASTLLLAQPPSASARVGAGELRRDRAAAAYGREGGQEPARQQSAVELRLTGDPGTPPRIAVPDLLALSNDKETQDAARVISEVLWSDLDFEREFALIPRDTYKSIPVAATIDAVPFDRWRELGADGVVIGTVQKTASGIRVEMRLYSVRARQSAFAKEYTGAIANPRFFAHTMSDELHQSQRNLRGVARTKLAFISDRNREAVVSTVEKRDVKEVYIADYDGANPRRMVFSQQARGSTNCSR